MLLRGLLLVVVLACSSKREAPKAEQVASVGSQSDATPLEAASASEQGSARDILFVPAAITNQLAGTDTIFAINLANADVSTFNAMLPPELGCARDLIKSLGVVVVAKPSSIVGFATKLPESQTRKCLEQVIRAMGGSTRTAGDGSYEVKMGNGGASLTWRDGITTVRELGSPPLPTGVPSRQLLTLARRVPVNADAFLLTNRLSDQLAKSMVMWARFAEDALEVTVRAEGADPGSAQRVLREFRDGAKEGLASKQIAVDDSWFEERVVGSVATLKARIPYTAFTPQP